MIEKAIIVATKAHKGQLRKSTNIPYIFHPLSVAAILSENECSLEVIVAGILHDTIEDTNLTAEYIEEVFGKSIKRLVLGASETNRDILNVTWEDRKQHTINFLENKATEDEKQVSCADKLHNMRSIKRDYINLREELWDRFNAGYEKQKWYYTSLVNSLKSLEDYDMYKELCELVEFVFDK